MSFIRSRAKGNDKRAVQSATDLLDEAVPEKEDDQGVHGSGCVCAVLHESFVLLPRFRLREP